MPHGKGFNNRKNGGHRYTSNQVHMTEFPAINIEELSNQQSQPQSPYITANSKCSPTGICSKFLNTAPCLPPQPSIKAWNNSKHDKAIQFQLSPARPQQTCSAPYHQDLKAIPLKSSPLPSFIEGLIVILPPETTQILAPRFWQTPCYEIYTFHSSL